MKRHRKSMKGRRLLAGLLTAALAVGNLMISSPVKAEETVTKTLLARYELLTDVQDSSGNERHGTSVGAVTFGSDTEAGMILPGGRDSTTNYVEIPGEMFVGQENLTISAWVKSEVDAGNWSALFFGTEAQENNTPVSYWLFNPYSPQKNFKSVFTDSVNYNQPYNSEVGLNQTTTAQYKSVWTHYTTVITPTTITGYINGEKIGVAAKSRKVEDFGTSLFAYIGRSNYTGDWPFAGSFQDVCIYGEALTQDEIQTVMGEAPADNTKAIVVKKAQENLTLDGLDCVKNNLVLPDTAGYGTTITWSSSNTAVISVDGTVAPTENDETVTLTATIALGSVTETKDFTAFVPANGGELYLHYDFSQIEGTTVTDISGNGYDGTLRGTGYSIAGDELTLPGGAAGSTTAPYVEIPTGTFDNQDTLTISLWLKNGTGAGNYSGMFFGNASNYWLLNPCNPDGYYKSVFTNSENTSKPYITECGISPTIASNGIQGPATDNQWALYTTVIQPDRITAYYNNTLIGSVEKSRNVSEFGTGLLSYIGKSTYNDIFYKGGVRDVRVYTYPISQEDVTRLYYEGLKEDTLEQVMQEYLDNLTLPYKRLVADISLPAEGIDGSIITWSSSNPAYLSDAGKITRPEYGSGDQAVTLTASITYRDITKEKTFNLTVVEKPYGTILTYVRSGNTDRTDALHVGYSNDQGSTYQALHNNQPILYTESGAKKMGSPMFFRKADGTYGMIADDDHNSSYVVIYDSTDLITFTNPRYVAIDNSGRKIWNPNCVYQDGIGNYAITYESSDGNSYVVYTTDFASFTTPEIITYQKSVVTADQLPEGAIECGVFEATKEEYDAILKKYSRVVNTSISEFDSITVQTGTDKDSIEKPVEVTASYSDGTTKNFGVDWSEEDWAKVNVSKAGTYTVQGTIRQPDYGTVLIEQRADPYVIKAEDGTYYFTASYPVCGNAEDSAGIGYDRIVLRHADTIEGLADAEEIVIWNQADSAKAFRYIWAPEIHYIGGSWYILFTASRSSNNVWDIRPHMLKCMGDDPMNPDNWKTEDESNLHQVTAASEDSDAFVNFSLDMTYFESAGKHYVAWAEKPNNISKIYLAEIDPDEPWQLISNHIVVSTPEFAWEWSGGTIINEGPAVLKHDGKIHLCFSAAAVDYTYCVGMLTAEEGANLLDIDSWTKYPTPLLQSEDFEIKGYEPQCGPGHNSFTYDLDGNPVIVYHARPMNCSNAIDADGNYGTCSYVAQGTSALNDPCRHARAKSLNFAADGTPILNMTAEEELKTTSVTLTVVVEGDDQPVEFYAEQGEQITLPVKGAKTISSITGDASCEVAADGNGILFTGNDCGTMIVHYIKSDNTDVKITVHVYAADNKAYVLDYGLTVDLNAAGNDAFGLYKVADTNSYSMTGENLPAAGDSDVAVLKGFRLSGTQDEYSMQVSTEDAILNCIEEKLLYTPTAFMEDADVYDYQVEVKKSADTVVASAEDGVAVNATLTVVPATVVYYEDDFSAITVTNYEREGVSSENIIQSNDQSDIYGYDAVYGENTGTEKDLILHYDFSNIEADADGNVSDNTVVTDISGNGGDAIVYGSGITVSGDILTLSASDANTAPYLKLPDGITVGKKAVTVSMWLKNCRDNWFNAAFYLGEEEKANDPSYYWMLNPKNGNMLRAIVKTSSYENKLEPDVVQSTDDWALYTMVLEEGKFTVYYNGEKVRELENEGTSCAGLGDNPVAYIGNSGWEGEFYTGDIRDVRIYDRALEQEEITAIYEEVPEKTLDSAGGSTRLVADSGDKRGTMSFTFKGTGFDVVGRSTTETGGIALVVRDSAGALIKSQLVDTVYPNGQLYQLPIVSVKNLEYGTYTVEIKALKTGTQDAVRSVVYIDGIRIYHPAGIGETADSAVTASYKQEESGADIAEIREMLLGSVKFASLEELLTGKPGTDSGSDTGSAASEASVSLVAFDPDSGTSIQHGGSVIVEGNASGTADLEEILKQGANNEVYLGKGSAIAFRVVPVDDENGSAVSHTLQVELKKALDEKDKSAQLTVLSEGTDPQIITRKSYTAMYYEIDLSKCKYYEDTNSYLVVLASTGDSMISLTNLKSAGYQIQALNDSDYVQTSVVSDTYYLMRQEFLEEEAQESIEELPFTDVKTGDWYEEYVQYVYRKEIMTGLDRTYFGPSEELCRAQFAVILYRMEGEPETEYQELYQDVKEGEFYTNAVIWASENGIVTGYTEGEKKGYFGPSDCITREQMMTMMYRYAAYKGEDVAGRSELTKFPDGEQVSGFAADAASWSVAEGLISGDKGRLLPQGSLNRAECAAIIQRFIER